MREPLISVISIIYGVAPYLRQCLESLKGLDYPELELILVIGQKETADPDGNAILTDDGCLKIAGEYARKDDRFRIVTCKAAGAGNARNIGIDAARGEYIGFVDGDDFVDPDMFTKLFSNLKAYDADISVCAKYDEYPDRTAVKGIRLGNNTRSAAPEESRREDSARPTATTGKAGEDSAHPTAAEGTAREDSVRLLGPEEAVEHLISDGDFFFHCWDKLFKAELFKGVSFPEDRVLEDRFVIGDLIMKASRIVYDSTPLYHFRVRTDSLSHTKGLCEENSRADTEFCRRAVERFPGLKDRAEAYLLYGHITCVQLSLADGSYSRAKQEEHLSYIRHHAGSAFKNPFVNNNTRIKVFLSLYSPGFLKLWTEHSLKKQGKIKGFSKDGLQ